MKTLISRCRHGIATSFVLLRHRTVVGVYRRSRFAGAIGPPSQRHCFYNNTQLGQHEVYSGGTFTAWRNTRCTAGKWGCCPRRNPLEPLLGSSWNRSLGLPWRSTGGGGKAPLGCCSSHVASLADSNAAHGLGLHLLLFRWAAVSRSSPSSPGPAGCYGFPLNGSVAPPILLSVSACTALQSMIWTWTLRAAFSISCVDVRFMRYARAENPSVLNCPRPQLRVRIRNPWRSGD